MKRRKLKENGVKMKWQSGISGESGNVKWQRGVAKIMAASAMAYQRNGGENRNENVNGVAITA
jgi:hypothetical protein